MALIQCPECGGMVSDKAVNCIHCGYPLGGSTNQKQAVYKIFVSGYKNNYARSFVKNMYQNITGAGDTIATKHFDIDGSMEVLDGITNPIAEQLVQRLNNAGCTSLMLESSSAVNDKYCEMAQHVLDGAIFCPRCHSMTISTGKRGFSVATGFIGSNKTVNRCAKCGYTWKP